MGLFGKKKTPEEAAALGKKYLNDGNVRKAEKELLFAAEHGNLGAHISLGLLYKKKKEYEQAEKWFLKGAELGNPDGYYLLADMHTFDMGSSVKIYFNYYKKYLETGDNPSFLIRAAQTCIDVYHFGRLAPPDNRKALECALKGAELDSQFCMKYCAELYLKGGAGLKPDLEKARYWGEKAGLFNRDSIYCDNWFLKKFYAAETSLDEANRVPEAVRLYQAEDYDQAVPLMYELAQEYTVPEAQYYYGLMREKGLRAPKDYNAYHPSYWFYMAAEKGNMEAQYKYACFNDQSADQEADKGSQFLRLRRHALHWYQEAAKQGHKEAKAHAEQIEALAKKALAYNGMDEKEALRLLEQAAAMGSPEACHECGARYLNGRGVRQDVAEGIRYIDALSYTWDEGLLADVASTCACGCLELGNKERASYYYSIANERYTSGMLLLELGESKRAYDKFNRDGSRKGYIMCALMHMAGDGVERSQTKAQSFLNLTGLGGSPNPEREINEVRAEYLAATKRFVQMAEYEEVEEVEEAPESAQSGTQKGTKQNEWDSFSFPMYLYDEEEHPWELTNSGYDNATYYCQATGESKMFYKSDFDLCSPSGFHQR